MAHFAFSYIYYFRWTAVLIAATKSFWGETINVKYGNKVNFMDIANHQLDAEILELSELVR